MIEPVLIQTWYGLALAGAVLTIGGGFAQYFVRLVMVSNGWVGPLGKLEKKRRDEEMAALMQATVVEAERVRAEAEKAEKSVANSSLSDLDKREKALAEAEARVEATRLVLEVEKNTLAVRMSNLDRERVQFRSEQRAVVVLRGGGSSAEDEELRWEKFLD
jgi:hypothetical protein